MFKKVDGSTGQKLELSTNALPNKKSNKEGSIGRSRELWFWRIWKYSSTGFNRFGGLWKSGLVTLHVTAGCLTQTKIIKRI